MHPFQARIIRFYRRWHALEQSLGLAIRGLVIDFDMAPRVEGDDRPYEARSAALAELGAIRQAAVTTPSCNRVYLEAKLGGSEAYLRALMGERQPFADYNLATMGYATEAVPETILERWRDELQAELAGRGIPWSAEGRKRWSDETGRAYAPDFEVALRSSARSFVGRLADVVPGLADPDYTIEVVEEDAYWANWIDGSAEAGVVLKINTHPRIEYRVNSPVALAAHEIGGHAMHVAALRRGAEQGTVDPAALCLTVHACEAFQMEGLAQVLLELLGDEHELDSLASIQAKLRRYGTSVVHNAQIALESGRPIDEVLAHCQQISPMSKPRSVESALRDRARSPLLRSYMAVYGPSRELFMRAVALPEEQRRAFFSDAYTALWTPEQLAARL